MGNGDYIWVKLDAVVIAREPEKVTIYCAYAEVQTLVETQMELQRKRALLNSSMESANISAWWLDMKNHVAILPEKTQEKYQMGTIIPNMPEAVIETGIIDPVSVDDFRRMFEKIYRGEKVTQEIKMYHKDTDTTTWERLIYEPMYDKDGNYTEAVGTSVDITDEKLQKQLEKAVVAANQASKAKTDFLARMSHDMRTPMNAIIGLTALTLDQADNPQVVRENLSKMREASDFLLGLVNDILDMARIEDNSMKLKMEPYRYSDFLLNMKTMFKPQCEAKGIDITFAESTLNVYGMADKLRINQIFFNIFSNAVKYTPAGGSIRCSVENIQMDGKEISGDYIIQDTGIGMSEKFQKSLFRPFTQESDEVTPELQGSGLGLSITKRLVELMGGTIYIESEQGKGTKVTVHLTFELLQEEPKQSTMKEEPKVAELDLTEKKVLLVEDHPLNAEIARRLLEKKNMLVTYAENGKIALDMFRASEINSFDVILMDIRMPVMSGLAAAEEIRSLDRSDAKTVPIIAMTANAYAEDVQRSLEAGMNAHLVKPIEPSVLYETIAKEIH